MTIQMPYSKEAEQALLGAFLVDGELVGRVNISDHDFYEERHRVIYSLMRQIKKRGNQVDYITIAQEMRANSKYSLIGGDAYLTQLVEVGNSTNAESYASIVKDMSRRRATITAAQKLATAAYDLDGNLDKALADGMTKLSQASVLDVGAMRIDSYVSKVYDGIERASKSPNQIYGIPTGMRDFDKLTHGLQAGEMVILSGEPGLGKSLLAFQLCMGMAKFAPGAVYELEMSGVNTVRRYLSAMTGITTASMRAGTLPEGGWEKVTSAVDNMANADVYMSDRTDWTTLGIRSDIARLKSEHGIKWVLVDYLEILKDNYGDNPIDRGAYISGQLHDIFKDLELGGLVIDSMNKEGLKAATPEQQHLGGAVRKVYNADSIIFMAKDKANENIINLTWAKNREGESGLRMQLMKKPDIPVFYPVDKNR